MKQAVITKKVFMHRKDMGKAFCTRVRLAVVYCKTIFAKSPLELFFLNLAQSFCHSSQRKLHCTFNREMIYITNNIFRQVPVRATNHIFNPSASSVEI